MRYPSSCLTDPFSPENSSSWVIVGMHCMLLMHELRTHKNPVFEAPKESHTTVSLSHYAPTSFSPYSLDLTFTPTLTRVPHGEVDLV